MKKNERTEQDYRDAASKSFSIAGMCRALGLGAFGANYRRVHKAIKEYNIDTSHFTGQGWNVAYALDPNESHRKELSEILVKNSTYDNTNSLKLRLLYENLKERKCERCKRTEWEGQPIPLQLHHVNGDRSDNRLENLQLLCPNCHALTDNYCGKNKQTILLSKKEREEKFKSVYGDKTREEIFGEPKLQAKETKKYCPICGKEVKNRRARYCSVECAYKAQRKLPQNEILIRYINEGKTNTEISNLCGVTEACIRKWRKDNKI